MTKREQEQTEYDEKYAEVPRDYNERIAWMIEKFNISPRMMDQIIEKKRAMEYNLQYYDYMVVEYSYCHSKPRPRYRLAGIRNYMDAAKINSSFIHVYSPNAAEDFKSMHRLIGDELDQLHLFIQTPCTIMINVYEQTPNSFSIPDKFLAEYGLIPSISMNDYDNYLKATSDRLNTNLWLDDSLVVSGTVNKYYSMLPRQEIFIRYLNYVPNRQLYNNITGRKGYKEDFGIDFLDKKGQVANETH